MYLSIIFLPLFGSIVAGFFGRKVGIRGAQLITTSCVVIATVLAVLAFIEVGINNVPVSIHLFRWIDSEWLYINWGFHFDSLTVAMLLPVLIISSLVHVYSISYMQNDPQYKRSIRGFSRFTLNKHRLVDFKPFIQKRYYSNRPKLEDKSFFEWFSGLTDSEGSFMFLRKQDGYGFKFAIQLHIDDLKMLHFIQSKLEIGKVYITGSAARFVVTNLKETPIIINIFSRYPLNTTKFLNFQDYKKAFEIYTSSKLKTPEIIDKVEKIRMGMNKLRRDFTLGPSYSVHLTSYWLLGFVEGDGSFWIRNNFALSFNITQSSKDLVLMEAIRDFFNNLGSTVYANGRSLDNAAILYHSNNMVNLAINRLDYITKVLIPFFDALIWQSQKELDYQDWKTILKFRGLGHHYRGEGVRIINNILSQMNNNRLTTRRSTLADRVVLESEIKKLLEGPSNFEVKEDGRVFIKSLKKYYPNNAKIRLKLLDENGGIIKLFDSAADCAKYLNVSKTTVAVRLKKGKPFLFDNKLVSLNKIADIPL